MPRFITALFEHHRQAEQAIDELLSQGFEGTHIQHVDRQREREGFFERLFLDGNGSGRGEDVTLMGIRRARVEQYARLVRSGLSLVIVMCDADQTGAVREVISHYDVVDIGSLREGPDDLNATLGFDSALQISRGDDDQGWFEISEVDPDDRQRKGVRSHAVHVQARTDVHHATSDAMPGARGMRFFEVEDRDFKVHYAENFAGSDRPFEDYELAYRYGIRLADARPLERLCWEDIEAIARAGWEKNTAEKWERFGEAVRFGWRRRRQDRRQQEKERSQGRWMH